jgi:hypothetical protein
LAVALSALYTTVFILATQRREDELELSVDSRSLETSHEDVDHRLGHPAPDPGLPAAGVIQSHVPRMEPSGQHCSDGTKEAYMSFGVLLWLIGIPIPIILLLALFWHH